MKNLIMILTCFFASIGLSVAQTTLVSGTVVDNTGEAVIGASVVAKGTTAGMMTDIDGKFSFSIPSDKKTLVVSLIGMKTKDVVAGTNLKITLEDDSQQLEEIVINVPYGVTSKSSFSGSESTIGSKSFKDTPVPSFEQAIQGSAPGVNISSASGQPGSAQSITLRGIGSLNASTEPLYVIDGVPMVPENLSASGVSGSPGSLGISSLINTSDIESVTVLKDAAAGALYGSRGANGVIMITTKSGKSGKISVTTKATLGINGWAVKNRPIMGANDMRSLWTDSYFNYLQENNAQVSEEQNRIDAEKFVAKNVGNASSDWEKALFRKRGFIETYDATVSGGSEKTRFFVSLGYKKEEGKAKSTSFDQYTGRLNLNHDAGALKLGVNIAISKVDQTRVAEGTAYANPYFASRSYLFPTTPIYNTDGTYYEGPLLNGNDNLVKSVKLDQYKNDLYSTKSLVWAEYTILPNLKIKETLSYDYNSNNVTTMWPLTSGNGAALDGLLIKMNPTYKKLYSSTIATYSKSYGLHNFDLLAGWDVEKRLYTEIQAVGNNFPSDRIEELSGAATPNGVYSESSDDRMLSALSRLNYSYNDKYYGSATFRRDGSTRFGSNKRWGTFWSLSGSWRISQEDFIKDIKAISDLKLRSSYGVSGTLPEDLYGSLNAYTADNANYNGRAGLYPARIANPDLSWEKNHIFDLGLDLRLFDVVSIELDYYNRTTKDLLMEVPVTQTTGFSSYLKNAGQMNNRGFEFAIGWNAVNQKEFTWETRFNIAHNRNRIDKLEGGKEFTENGYFIRREGEAYNSFYVREFAGVNSETGAEQWVRNSKKADGSIDRSLTEDPTEAQRVITDKVDPKVTGGWTNTFTYKNFDLTALISFSLGGHFIDNGASRASSNGMYDFTFIPSKDQLGQWTKPGDRTSIGKRTYQYQYGNYTSSKWIHSTNHARLKNITLGYTLPKSILNKIAMSSVRFSATGTNLLTLKKTDGFDPEVPSDGIVGYQLPPLRSLVFAVEVSF